ncbi:MAG TPA: hypothetical protein VFV34_29145, partial [Blastocatellia bacterium]|nr:hypothetical protein [Blastocatellia bacterium]
MRRVLTLLFVLWACGGATVLGQTSGDIELTIAREGAGWKGGAKISLTGQQLSSEVRDIKVDGNEIQFTISVLESELHFVATLTGERMVGSIDGFQKGVRIAVGGWSVRRKPTRVVSRGFAGSWIGAFDLRSAPQPLPDPARHDLGFNASVAAPAYATTHPRILFDEAHNNPDTAGGRYKPFADLITSDGYNVSTNKSTLSRETLRDFDILVIVNASGPNENREAPAFTREECDAVQAWVTSGGALLLISDHAPF